MNDEKLVHGTETVAIFYLTAPLFLFFGFFVRISIAVPACILICFFVYDLSRKTHWRGFLNSYKLSMFYACIAAMWIWLSGGFGPLHQNGDWAKHYAVVNFLAQNRWPATAQIPGIGNAALRYSIGWYLFPALILKLSDLHSQNLVLSAWSAIGVFGFFSLLPGLVNSKRGTLIAPLVFMVFGGADLLGSLITGYQHGPAHHIEWWSGWIEYAANTTSIFWVPQHSIPAWLGIALLMRQRSSATVLPYLALLFSAISLWSPFAAMGLAPFAVALIGKHGLRQVALNWKAIASLLMLALPVAGYLLSGSAAVPHGFIWNLPCTLVDGACFTWHGYSLFLLIEICAPLIVLFLRGGDDRIFLLVTAITLSAIPLYRLGVTNDFAMRASIPALAVLAILLTKTLIGPSKRLVIATLLILLAAVPTSAGEILRGFQPGADVDHSTTFDAPWARGYLDQYFAPMPIWILKK